MVRKLKSVQTDFFFYYCLTKGTYMTFFKQGKAGVQLSTYGMSSYKWLYS